MYWIHHDLGVEFVITFALECLTFRGFRSYVYVLVRYSFGNRQYGLHWLPVEAAMSLENEQGKKCLHNFIPSDGWPPKCRPPLGLEQYRPVWKREALPGR